MNEPTSRRQALTLLGGAGLAFALAGCSSDDDTSSSSDSADATTTTDAASSDSTTTAATTTSCTTTAEETAGPFPADGSNEDGNGDTANVLDDDASTRADIRSDLDGSDTQDGVPLTLKVRVLDNSNSCAAKAGAAVYVWHCNKDGEYSQYNASMLGGDFTAYSWLRGVQVTDADGYATFTTILPGRYQGRAFHIHFEVYEDDTLKNLLLTSQMAADDDEITTIYEAADYSEALSNETLNDNDNVFGDGVDTQLLTFAGDVTSGLTASLTVAV